MKVKNDLSKKYIFQSTIFSFLEAVDSVKGNIRGIRPILYTKYILIKERLSQLLSLPISIANDATLAKFWMGSTRDVMKEAGHNSFRISIYVVINNEF